MEITLDIAATIAAVAWPIVVATVLLAYRRRIPALVEGLASRVRKLEFGGLSLELAKAKPFTPAWASETELDLRHTATALEVSDTSVGTFLKQLKEGGNADYAVIDLREGKEWLTSRLYIMAILFARMKGLKGLAFVETLGLVRTRYVGWAKPEAVRWAFAKIFPWLEEAYAAAYTSILSQHLGFVASNEGRLSYQGAINPTEPNIDLLKAFLTKIQVPAAPPPPDGGEWVKLGDTGNTLEHARWLTGEELEKILGEELRRPAIHYAPERKVETMLRGALSIPGQFAAVVSEDRRFEYLVNRCFLLEQIAKRVADSLEACC